MTRPLYDPSRHPSDLVSQTEARITNAARLTASYENAIAGRASPSAVQLLLSIAIAKIEQDERERVQQTARVIDIAPARRRRANRPRWLSPVGA